MTAWKIQRAGPQTPAISRLHFTFEHRGRTYDATVDATDAEARPIVDDLREQIVFRPAEEPRVLLAAAVAVNVVGAYLWLR